MPVQHSTHVLQHKIRGLPPSHVLGVVYGRTITYEDLSDALSTISVDSEPKIASVRNSIAALINAAELEGTDALKDVLSGVVSQLQSVTFDAGTGKAKANLMLLPEEIHALVDVAWKVAHEHYDEKRGPLPDSNDLFGPIMAILGTGVSLASHGVLQAIGLLLTLAVSSKIVQNSHGANRSLVADSTTDLINDVFQNYERSLEGLAEALKYHEQDRTTWADQNPGRPSNRVTAIGRSARQHRRIITDTDPDRATDAPAR